MEYCEAGKHTTLSAYKYDGRTWCLEHPCPAGPVDRPERGVCNIGRPHTALVYALPPLSRLNPSDKALSICGRHLRIVVETVLHRGQYGR